MDPYRTHKPTSSVSKVKVVNGSLSSPRSARNLGPVISDRTRENKDKHQSPLWNMNRHIANGFSPSFSNGTPVHGSSLSNFGFASGSSTNGYETHQHAFGGKPSFGSPVVQYRAPHHRNDDHEEAMDVDGQEDMEVHAPVSSGTQPKMHNTAFNQSSLKTWKVLNTNKLNLPSTSKETKEPANTNTTSSSPTQHNTTTNQPNKEPAKKKAIYIVLHISDVVIGTLNAKATAPVKIYAGKLFLEIEFKDSSVLSLKLPCTDISHCTVCLEQPKPVIAFTLTDQGIKVVNDKKKEPILHANKKDGVMNKVVLYLNYSKNGLPHTIKEDITELFQRRLSNSIQWSEMSQSEISRFLYPEEQTAESKSETNQSDTTENEPEQSAPSDSPTGRKILTPKKGRVSARKALFESQTTTASSSKSKDEKSKTPDNTIPSEASPNKIVTRSRRRKAEVDGGTSSSPPKTTPTSAASATVKSSTSTDSEPQIADKEDQASVSEEPHNLPNAVHEGGTCDSPDRDLPQLDSKETDSFHPITQEGEILQRHSKMESHISILGMHSEEQRHTLQHHQKLLTLERAERTRSFERIQELQSTQRENQLRLLDKNESIALLEREVESQKVTVRQLQQELSQERESSTLIRKVQSDLVQTRRELDEQKVVRGIRDKQLQEKQAELEELRRLCTEESNSRRRVEDELQRTQNSCLQHMDELENQHLFRQTQEHELQGREERLQASEQRYQDERTARINLEDQLRRLRIENEELRCSRDATENELAQERQRRREESDSLNQERQTCEQRLRESASSLADCERRLQELQMTVNNSQTALDEHRRIEPRDWIIRRDEVTLLDVTLGNGAWGSVKVGVFRSCKVAVKQIHELILSPHNRRLFEREMSIASRCRHPCLLQFIGATNDDGIPLFITELLDTDLRGVLSRRSLHQEEIIAIALDIARALNYLHLSKPYPIIHRDISSSNVLLWKRDTCWRAKLSDYGAANFMRQYMTVNPGAGIYAAPEVSTNQQSPKVDIYSFGLLLCELCIRELPVPQHKQEQIALVTNGMLRELVLRCVRDDPETRPTMADVITLLTQQQENLLDHCVVSLNGRSASL